MHLGSKIQVANSDVEELQGDQATGSFEVVSTTDVDVADWEGVDEEGLTVSEFGHRGDAEMISIVDDGTESITFSRGMEMVTVDMGLLGQEARDYRLVIAEVKKVLKGLKERVLKLGIPGLVVYNVVDGLAHAVPTYAIKEGSVEERMMTAGVVGGIAVLTNATFWLMLGMTGMKVKEMMKGVGRKSSLEGGDAEQRLFAYERSDSDV